MDPAAAIPISMACCERGVPGVGHALGHGYHRFGRLGLARFPGHVKKDPGEKKIEQTTGSQRWRLKGEGFMKTLGAFAIFAALVILPTAGCGYHHHPFRGQDRTEFRRAHEDFRRAGWEAREELR